MDCLTFEGGGDLSLFNLFYALGIFLSQGLANGFFAPSEGHQHGGHKVTETSVIEFCHRNKMLSL